MRLDDLISLVDGAIASVDRASRQEWALPDQRNELQRLSADLSATRAELAGITEPQHENIAAWFDENQIADVRRVVTITQLDTVTLPSFINVVRDLGQVLTYHLPGAETALSEGGLPGDHSTLPPDLDEPEDEAGLLGDHSTLPPDLDEE